jgi:hypothetical protein
MWLNKMITYYKFRMAKAAQNIRSRITTSLRSFQLENAFLIFAVIYVPVSLLFMDRGVLATALLILYTLALSFAGLLLITRFMVFVAKSANEHNGQYGSLLIIYVFNFLIPILGFKYIVLTVWKMLPCSCGKFGLFADGVRLAHDLLNLFNVQQHLTWMALGSLILVSVFTLWSIKK